MSTALNCLICRPPELERLLQADPTMERVWLALPRRHLAPKETLHAAGDTLTRSWLVEQGLVRTYYLTAEGIERNRSFHAEGSWLGGGVPPVPSICPYTMEAMEPTANQREKLYAHDAGLVRLRRHLQGLAKKQLSA